MKPDSATSGRGASGLRAAACALAALAACAPEPSPAAAGVAPEAPAAPAAAIAPDSSGDERALLRAKIADLEERLLRAEGDLRAEVEKRLQREREWLQYTNGIAKLESLAQGTPKFEVDPEVKPKPVAVEAAGASTTTETQASPAEPAPAGRLDELTAAVVARRLRTLLVAEQVHGLDVMELGNVAADHVGPVVLRVLDDRGRLLSVLAADSLRLECSRAGRNVTLVLEHGYERRNGEAKPFDGGPAAADGRGGVRRILVPDCDPRPWLEGLPFLFKAEALQPVPHDGSVSVEAVRAALNIKLREDAVVGHWRVDGIGGVMRGVLYEIALSQLDEKGNVQRTLVADKASIAPLSKGVEVLLEGGAQVKADSTVPFLEGRYRLVLPRADAEAWRAARIPLVDPQLSR